MIDNRRLNALLAANRARPWPGPARSERIEEFIMSQTHRSDRRRRLAAWLGVGALVIGGGAIAATQIYRSYHVRIQAPGQAPIDAELAADAKGDAHGTVAVNGGTADVAVTNQGGQKRVQVEISGAAGAHGPVTVTTKSAGGN